MVIRVRSKDGPNLFIPLPTGLFCSRLTAGIAARAASKSGVSITPEQMTALFRSVRRYKRLHPDWVLAEVQSADGDYVYVRL